MCGGEHGELHFGARQSVEEPALSSEKTVALKGRPPRERWTRSSRGSLAEPGAAMPAIGRFC
jgi:hypothetical protein